MKKYLFCLLAAACALTSAFATTPPGTTTDAAAAGATPGATAALAVTAAAVAAPYTVVGGTKVDPKTMNGWRTWRAMACERCHGAAQEGLVGPSLVNSLKVLTRDEFKNTVLHGRVPKGMPNFDGSKQVTENIDNLYAYLKGRSDGAIQPGHLQEIGK
jgi:mono/diheme cytochrome c family protein